MGTGEEDKQFIDEPIEIEMTAIMEERGQA
jgi:hypothetical protein